MAGDIAVVLGASGGTGGALVEALQQDRRFDHLAALSRGQPRGWVDDDRATWLAAEILDEVSLASAAQRIGALGAPNFFIGAAGILHGDRVTPEKSLRALDPRAPTPLFQVNGLGPALAARYLMPLAPPDRVGVFAALSARVGSPGDNPLGGWYGYRASKTATNMLIRPAAIEHRRGRPLGIWVAIHPGAAATALSAPFLSNRPRDQVFSSETAVGHVLRVLDGLGPADCGHFDACYDSTIP